MTQYKPTRDEYTRAALELVRDFAPPVLECKKCYYPYIKGYVCAHCGSETPHEEMGHAG